MGAEVFITRAVGTISSQAFNNAQVEACYEAGNNGYTGTIAEKSEFTMIDCPEGIDPEVYAWLLIDNEDPRVDDKWGPAGCIDCKNGYLYFLDGQVS